MKVAALIKQVPDTTAKIILNGGALDEASIKWSMSPYDEYALEAALSHAEAHEGEVIAITFGPERADKMLKDAAAVGAKHLFRVWDDGADRFDALGVATALAEVAKAEGAEMIFAGKASADLNMSTTGPCVAAALDWPCISFVSEYDNDSAVRVGPSGKERVTVPPNCVITCDKGLPDLRRANVKGIMMAKKATIEVIAPTTSASKTHRGNLSSPPEKAPGRTFEGADSMGEVVQLLRNDAKVI